MRLCKKEYTPSLLFESYTECIQAGFASSNKKIRCKIEQGDLGWRYAHVGANNNPLRIPYIPNEGEMNYKTMDKRKLTE
jgi:hypothetical protein